MRTRIELNSIELPTDIANQMKEKVGKLQTFYDNIVDAIVYLRENNIDKEVDLKLIVKNDTLFVKGKGSNFQDALDNAVDIMARQVKKYKETTLKNS